MFARAIEALHCRLLLRKSALRDLLGTTEHGLCEQFTKNALMRFLFRSAIWRFKFAIWCFRFAIWCFRLVGGLFWRTTNGGHSRIDPFPSASPASGGRSRGERELGRPIVVRQNASVGEKPRTDGLAILTNSTVVRLFGTKKT